ncbi:MAG: bifunctional UDP-N-acetylglucosamine diphosphorylase/glucosamine-1-phosphate N-acetyltransferase GlmU, partial [Rhodobacteraceae bacterium]|nr:bifunctional UDP-N-acetylglucosamine diphosphorylase/glucosamine-1-phosphate N-acetyltransferase GlmU [Paracoccaceae bacterium]
MATALIVLAAGMGTRMNSDLPKVLHQVAGAPLLVHALKSAAQIEAARCIVVAGHGAEAVGKAAKSWDKTIELVLQPEQKGTGHAVDMARTALADFTGDVIVLYGDTPFIQPETLAAMQAARRDHDVVVLGFSAKDPGRYGRLVMEGDSLQRIVEYKDATETERAITLCNSGVIAADCTQLFDLISQISNANASGEYYLTDVVGLARAHGLSATAVTCDEAETMGINSRAELAQAEAAFQARARANLLADGITLTAPETVFLAHDTVIGRDSVIEPH